ncbi:MAG: PAS domain S-box protein [Planctomycetaceae bacterium]
MASRNPDLIRMGDAPATAKDARDRETLVRSAERLSSLMGMRSCGIHVVEYIQLDPDQPFEPIVVSWSAGAEAIYGHSAAEVLGRSVSVIVPPDRMSEYYLGADRLRGGEEIEELETQRLHKDGRLLDVTLNIAPIAREGLGVVGAAVITQDITRRRRAEQALVESEQRFQAFMDNGPTIAFMKDARGRYIYANRRCAEALGRPAGDWVGRTDFDMLPSDVARLLHTHDERVLRERRVLHVEEEVRFHDGRVLPVLTVKFPFETAEGSSLVGGVAIDVTERDASRKEMAKLVGELRERVKELTSLHDLARLLQDKSLSLAELLRRAATLLPVAWRYPEIASARITLGGDVFETPGFEESCWRQRSACLLADGRPMTVEVAYNAKRPSSPEGEGPFAIEERKLLESFSEMLCGHLDALRATEALARSERRHRAIVETVRDAIFTISPSGQLTSLSPAFETMTGWNCIDWIGKPFTPLVHPDDLPFALEMFQRVLEGESPRLFQLRIRKADGDHIVGEFTATPQTAEGRLVSVLGVARDITDRMALEERLAHAQKMEAIGRFAGGIAHDFNNVLTAIGGCGELLLDRLSPADPKRELAAEICDAVQRAAALTRQLLLFSRREPHDPAVLDLNEIVRSLRTMLLRLLGERIELELELDESLGRVHADSTRVEQSIVNLVVNARDAMPDGGTVVIRTRDVRLDEGSPLSAAGLRSGRYALLEVVDTGCGIDEATLARVFEPFFTTKRPGAGTGLGLATVFGIVQQCGGHVGIDSVPGEGTTIRVHLPTTLAADNPPN